MKNEPRLKKVVPINTVWGGHFPCTGVIEIYDNTEDTTGDEEGVH